jgi:hypothetical protein
MPGGWDKLVVWMIQTIYDALYKALDTLEELDPIDSKEPWFELLEKTLDRAVKSRLGRV